MQPDYDESVAIARSRMGLMVLNEHFGQRRITSTHSSFRSMFPLNTPSGAQFVESELEAKLLEQLAFSLELYDVISQPIIHYKVGEKQRRYTPDFIIELCAKDDDAPCRFIIEVKRRADIDRNFSKYSARFAAGRAAAQDIGALFRIIDETQIRTPYLVNAKRFRRYLTDDPDLQIVDDLRMHFKDQSFAVNEAISFLGSKGLNEADARSGIEHALAWRLLLCDLSLELTDTSLIQVPPIGHLMVHDDDPILRTLRAADSGKRLIE